MTVEPDQGSRFTTADILDAAKALGVLSSSAHSAPRILATLCNPGVSAAEIAKLIGREPGLTARVLRVANSAFYGLSRSVATIDRAVVVLGLDAVRGVAAAACLDRTVLRASESSPVDMVDMLRHSIAAAAAAEALAKIRHPALAPEAFIAGLLHDFGVTLQLRLNPGGVTALIEALRADPDLDIPMLEEQTIGAGHERCAAVIFEAWNIPPSLVESARHHHDPAAAPEPHRALAALVNLGNHLGLTCGMTFPCEPVPGPRSAAALALLGLTDADVDAVAASLPQLATALHRALAAA